MLLDETDKASRIPLLKTAEQYPAWRVRVADRCWALTGKDVFHIKDNACLQALQGEKKAEENWVGKCWLIITGAIHDDLLMKVAHVDRGKIESLLIEINAALVIYSAEEIQPLRLELYGATMQKEGHCDLQTYIAYLLERQKKLEFLKKKVEDDEMISIFLKGPYKSIFPFPGIYQPNSMK
jgi:hypothetical protein